MTEVPRSPGQGGPRGSGSAVWQGFQVDSWRVAAYLPETSRQIEEALALAFTGDHHAGQDAMHQGAQEILVATAHLTGDDRRPQHLLGAVVGGRHFRLVQEHESLAPMGADMVVEAIQL